MQKRMKVVVAIDTFKGCLRSMEANHAAAEGVRRAYPEANICEVAVSDGGEGFIDAMAMKGGELKSVNVHDPLMREVRAQYLLQGQTAVIEAAEACGLWRLKPEERNPLVATSYGVGEIVADAVRSGAKTIIVGLGGSGTSDAGQGMLEGVLGTKSKNPSPDISSILQGDKIRVIIATDVENPLCGKNGAAHVFSPQKGATAEMVEELDKRAKAFAETAAREMGFDCSEQSGAGAAGGLGYAFMQFLHAERRSGIDIVAETIGLDTLTADADLVITGEGSADRQTLMGKLPMGILRHSGSTPVILIAGRVSDREELQGAGFAEVVCINPPGLPMEEALRPETAKENIRKTVYKLISE